MMLTLWIEIRRWRLECSWNSVTLGTGLFTKQARLRSRSSSWRAVGCKRLVGCVDVCVCVGGEGAIW